MTRARVLVLPVLLGLALAPPAFADPVEKLPDLVQQVPVDVGVVDAGGGAWHLGFTSAVENHGTGELRLESHRADETTPDMTTDQVVELDDGTSRTYSAVSTTFFYGPHDHWHYLNFDRYSLRRESDGGVVAPDHKQGFCLGDRYSNAEGNEVRPPTQPGPYGAIHCNTGEPDALQTLMGMSPGYGDDYYAQLEGQYIDLTGVPAGRYDLVHVANEDCTLHEAGLVNNAAAVKVDISYAPDGTPIIDTLSQVVDASRYAPCGAAPPPPPPPSDGGGSPPGDPGSTAPASTPSTTTTTTSTGPATTTSSAAKPKAPSARIVSLGSVTRAGWVHFRVRCQGAAGARCRGSLAVSRTRMVRGRATRQQLAHQRFSLRAGATAVVRARLSHFARRLLTRLGALPVSAAVRLDAGANGARPAAVGRGFVLRAPGAKASARLATAPAAGAAFLCSIG